MKTHQEHHEHHNNSNQMEHKGHSHDSHAHTDHTHHNHAHHHGNFKEIFFKSLPIGILIMLLSPFMGLTDTGLIHFAYADILVAILSTGLLFYGGKPFFQGAMHELKQKEPEMMALVSLGISVSYLYSIYAVIIRYTTGNHLMDFFFEFASLILIMLLGHWLEMEALGSATDARASLAELLPKEATLINHPNQTKQISITELQIGDKIRIQAGENIPADGKIIQGESRINESLLTGESKPILKKETDAVIGGSTNGEGQLIVEVTQIGQESFIQQIQDLVTQAQGEPSRAENLANKIASLLFYIAISAAFIAFVIWFTQEDLEIAITYMVTTLVIACPHALGLAIPLVVSRSTSLGAHRGLLIKDRNVYDLTSKADYIILDKTGTLTTGEFKVLDTQIFSESMTNDEFIALLAGIESGSSHPIAQSIIEYAQSQGIQAISFDDIQSISGSGVKGTLNGKEYRLISQKAWGEDLDIQVPAGATLSLLIADNEVLGSVALGDQLKSSSQRLISILKENQITPIMATGDNDSAAREVAQQLDIEYHSNMTPQEKYDLVKSYQDKDNTVIMVGDGINDAPSLALADVGVAIGAGTQVAIDSADVILTQSDPGDIIDFVNLSVQTHRKMNQNLAWGAGYNFIAIPLAAGLLAPIGISLTPSMGAILMTASTIIVALNALTLKID